LFRKSNFSQRNGHTGVPTYLPRKPDYFVLIQHENVSKTEKKQEQFREEMKSGKIKSTKKKKESKIEYGNAIYFQRTKAVQEEFTLIGVVTEREELIGKLQAIIRDVKEERRDCEDDTILETFKLFNQVRFSTIKAIKAISRWQDSFTRQIRPLIFGGDYIVQKLLKHINFVNSSKMRRIFNFQFFRGNPLLLPFPNLSTQAPIKVSPQLGKEIRDFAFPNENDVVQAYQILLNSLPDEVYKEQLVSLNQWLIEPWTPRIWICNSNLDQKFFTASGKPKGFLKGKEEGEEEDDDDNDDEGEEGDAKKKKPKTKFPPLSVKIPAGKNLLLRSNSAGRGLSPTSKGKSPKNSTPKSHNNEDDDNFSPMRRNRRNQLVPQQADQLKSFTDLAVMEDIIKAAEEKKKEEAAAANRLTEAARLEIDSMEEYTRSLERVFLRSRQKGAGNPSNQPLLPPMSPLPGITLPDQFNKTAKLQFYSVTCDGSTVIDDEEEAGGKKLDLMSQSESASHPTKSVEAKPKRKDSGGGGEADDGEGGEEDEEEGQEEENEGDDGTNTKDDSNRNDEAENRDKLKEMAPKTLPKLTKADSRRISDLTVTFSVGGDSNNGEEENNLSSSVVKRKASHNTAASSTSYKKNLSKIKLSTGVMRDWFKHQGK
jgi:hypothetical protein